MTQHPLVYEVNTRCWLREVQLRHGRPLRLGDVPDEEFERWQQLGVTHLWLMGVWEVGPRSRAESVADAELRRACAEVLPDFEEKDLSGSPYAIARYRVARELGGETGLKRFRAQLAARGLKLLLDFIGNHVGLDHPWVADHPEWFVRRSTPAPETFRQASDAGDLWLAHGKDPNFPAWPDTAQLDYRRPDTRAAVTGELKALARRCDGLRCDMAMLQLNDVFVQTWQGFPTSEPPPASEFWTKAIAEVKTEQPRFLFLAEAYWNLEPRLLECGFDFAYDKRLYDGLVARDAAAMRQHLMAQPPALMAASAHFLENHDEARIAALLPLEAHRAAALLVLGLPGLRLLHDGQLTGARLHTRVQLGRRPLETPQADVVAMYQRLLAALSGSAVGRGQGQVLIPRPAWAQNRTWEHFIVVQWQAQAPAFDLVVVNLSAGQSQCYVPLEVRDLARFNWQMADLLGEERYERYGDDLQSQGLYLDVPPHAAQLFHFRPL